MVIKQVFIRMLNRIKKLISNSNLSLPVGRIDFGDLDRLHPISTDWGISRGGPIDRYYIEGFLKKNSSDIKGIGLEILDDGYLKKFGAEKMNKRDILGIDPKNSKATIIADLAKADHIPDNT
jgi:hypothetical protein